MDRFISGQDVPDDRLRKAWQDTTQPHTVNDVPMYEAFFRAVRDVNRRLPRTRRMRVVLGDSPIDWDTIRDGTELGQWLSVVDRGRYAAEAIEREVLAKQRRALILYGDMHFQRRNILSNYEMPAGGLVSRLEQTATVFTIWTNYSADLQTVQPDVASWPIPSLTRLRGSVFGAKAFTFYLPGEGEGIVRITMKDGKPTPVPREHWRALAMEEQFDALLHFGPSSSLAPPPLAPGLCADAEYMKMRLWRMSLVPFPAGPDNPIDQLKTYCATVHTR
jgi:hypothetical protein